MPQKNLSQMVADVDYPDDVRQAILNDIAKSGNEARILTGELVLPSRQDAIHWHDAQTGRAGITDIQRQMEERIKQLEAQTHPIKHVEGKK